MSFSLTSIRSSLFALSVVLSMPGNAAATLLKSCENIMSTNNIKNILILAAKLATTLTIDRDTHKFFCHLQSNVFDSANLFQTNHMVH